MEQEGEGMSLKWYDERDDNDCDAYGVGPFRVHEMK